MKHFFFAGNDLAQTFEYVCEEYEKRLRRGLVQVQTTPFSDLLYKIIKDTPTTQSQQIEVVRISHSLSLHFVFHLHLSPQFHLLFLRSSSSRFFVSISFFLSFQICQLNALPFYTHYLFLSFILSGEIVCGRMSTTQE